MRGYRSIVIGGFAGRRLPTIELSLSRQAAGGYVRG